MINCKIAIESLNGFSVWPIFPKWSILAFFSVANICLLQAAETPSAVLSNPPTIKRLVAERIDRDGERTYFLLVYDAGNFVVKYAENLEQLTYNLQGGSVSGRVNDLIWSLLDDGRLLVSDLSNPRVSTPAEEREHSLAQAQNDFASRLGRAFLTLGIESDFLAKKEIAGDSFSFVGRSDKQEGKITIDTSSVGVRTFKVEFGIGKPEDVNLSRDYEITGELTAEGVANYFELWMVGGGARELLSHAIVREVEFSGRSIPEHVFRPENNISGGYHLISNLSNEKISFASGEWRRINLFGITMKPTTFRLMLLALAALMTLAIGVAVIRRKTKGHQ